VEKLVKTVTTIPDGKNPDLLCLNAVTDKGAIKTRINVQHRNTDTVGKKHHILSTKLRHTVLGGSNCGMFYHYLALLRHPENP